MELNELQKLGLVVFLSTVTEEEEFKSILSEMGKGLSSTWLQLSGEDQQELQEASLEGIVKLSEVTKQYLSSEEK